MSFENKNSDFFSENESFSSENTNNESCVSFPNPMNERLLQAITQIILKVISNNLALQDFNEIIKEQIKLPYSTFTIPRISIYDYLYRIRFYSEIEDNTLIISLIYIDRLCKLGDIVLIENNIHRLLFTSILIAVKYNEDNIYDNNYYANIAGINIKELNLLENDFCSKMKFNFYVEPKQFEQYKSYLNILIDDLCIKKDDE